MDTEKPASDFSIPRNQIEAAQWAVKRVAAAEQQLVRHAQRVLCVSNADRERLMALYGRATDEMDLVPNGTVVPEDAWLDKKRRDELKRNLGLAKWPLALFVGAYHGPNLDAVEAVVDMAQQCPDWCFAVAGSVGKHLDGRTLPSNLYMLGLVSEAELTTLLRAADVGLNPMLQGSGTNLKMLDYAGHGALVLSTPTGARGLAFVAGEHYMECEVSQFATTLQQLGTSSTLASDWHDMRTQARQQVANVYDWRVVAAGVLEP